MTDEPKGVHEDNDTYYQIKSLLGIPPDEPIFIIRAQDKFSIEAIKSYLSHVLWGARENRDRVDSWSANVASVINDFMQWQHNNEDKVKVPD